MIALLRGEVLLRRTDHVVVVCGGVGYRAAVSAETLRRLPAVGSEATLHTHLIARDDALLLFGFHSEQERDLFLMLLSVQAVGPKLAIAILSVGRPRELTAAIARGDHALLQSVPGIGRRTAERIVVELREKVGAQEGVGGEASLPVDMDDPLMIARQGLLELGYSPAEADRMLARADGQSAEALIAGALRAARAAK